MLPMFGAVCMLLSIVSCSTAQGDRPASGVVAEGSTVGAARSAPGGTPSSSPGTAADTTTSTAAPTVSTTLTSTTSASSAPTPAAGASGCGRAINGYVPIGANRRALVRDPGLGEPLHPVAAVVVLHGYTGTPERIEQTSGWTPFATAHGAIVVYAEGTPITPEGYAWTTRSARYSANSADDITYLAALVDTLVTTACVDPERILLTGESNGGAMVFLAACDARTRTRFRLVAPVIPAIDQAVVDRCGAGPPLTFAAIASRKDQTVPYDGTYPAGQVPLLPQEGWFLQAAALRNSCSPTGPDRTRIDDAEVIRPTGCAAGPTLVAIDDGVHTWPGGPVGTAGLPPGSFPATAYLWGLFSQVAPTG